MVKRLTALAAAAMTVTSASGAGTGTPVPPPLTFAFAARITLAAPIEQGIVDGKRKRFIAITGGTVTGPKLNGVILPGGGDWQSIHSDGLTEISARYSIKAADGTIIAITNPGVRVASPDIIARLSAGEDVDPALYYFRTSPVFEVASGPHSWLRNTTFVARGIRKPDHVIVEFFEVG
jgi:Protein of unknown function (DUF3237)